VRVNQAYGAFSKFFDTFGIQNGDDMYNSTNYYVW
jgi:predicted metalloendopeptidase